MQYMPETISVHTGLYSTKVASTGRADKLTPCSGLTYACAQSVPVILWSLRVDNRLTTNKPPMKCYSYSQGQRLSTTSMNDFQVATQA